MKMMECARCTYSHLFIKKLIKYVQMHLTKAAAALMAPPDMDVVKGSVKKAYLLT